MLQYALYKKGVLIMGLNYSKIDVIGATVEELKEALLNDQKTYGKMLEEISNLEGQKSEKKTDIPLFNNEVIENNNNGSSVDKDFEEEVDYYKKASLYSAEENIGEIKKIVKLSTCSYLNNHTTPTDQRYYIVAKLEIID